MNQNTLLNWEGGSAARDKFGPNRDQNYILPFELILHSFSPTTSAINDTQVSLRNNF